MRKLVLAVLLCASGVGAAVGLARPTSATNVPVARLRATIQAVKDWRDAEWAVRDAYLYPKVRDNRDEEVRNAIVGMKARQADVASQLKKLKVAGIKDVYLAQIKRDVAYAEARDKEFLDTWENPDARDPYHGPDDKIEWAKLAKDDLVAYMDRLVAGALGPVIELEKTRATMLSAIDLEKRAKDALAQTSPERGEARTLLLSSQAALGRAVDDVHFAQDQGELSTAQETEVVDAILEVTDEDDDALEALLKKASAADSTKKIDIALVDKLDALAKLEHAIAHPPDDAKTETTQPVKTTTHPATTTAPKPATTTKTTTTTPKPSGKTGPTCEAGHWSSQTLSVASPQQGHPTEYFFTTPIPNHDWFNLKRGYSSGGCNLSGGLDYEIDVIGSAGKDVAWNYTFGTPPGPHSVGSANDCPETVDGVVYERCVVNTPQLSVPLPKQGFEPPSNFTQDRNAFEHLAVIVPLDFNGKAGVGGSISIKIVWKPKQ